MSTELRMPKIGFSMTEAKLVAWLVPDGGTIEAGKPLYIIESDKAENEVESPSTGILRILKQIDEVYPVGELIGEIV